MLTVSTITSTADTSADDLVGTNRFECRSCPYQHVLDKRYFERKAMKQKDVEDVIGGAKAWENVDKTDVMCPSTVCGNDKAYFYQLQIRSADEPMTNFYKCTKCGRSWRE
ncbi:DNA-directed RNA polymeras-like protein III subunit RPC10 [Lophium mytilinum]|uniref:DNA-directed RNA polymerase subunit n=1 Tax=Lophium mytilinum TaxID=390894 RepID=A0A6A6RIZ5_9PEZI|nr:DNA-directed RNA polymeras-like protein III subunit RPC10 [Lophium mytilinum]